MGAPILKTFKLLEIARAGASIRVDREAGVIRGVKVLGLESANGRRYSREAVTRARGLYEGIRVNIDHPSQASAERKMADRFGRLQSVREERDGLYGDLQYLKSHPLAEMTAEAAERMPETFGLSHNAEGRGRQENGKLLIEEITHVRSVDLVTNPATTRSLFESDGGPMDATMTAAAPVEAGSGDMTWDMFVQKAKPIFDGQGDPGAKGKQIGNLVKALLKLGEDLEKAAGTGEAGGETKTPESAKPAASTDPSVVQLQEELRQLRGREEARSLLEAAGVPCEGPLVEAVAALPTADKRKALIESWPKGAVKPNGAAKPRSVPLTESRSGGATIPDLNSFVSSVTR